MIHLSSSHLKTQRDHNGYSCRWPALWFCWGNNTYACTCLIDCMELDFMLGDLSDSLRVAFWCTRFSQKSGNTKQDWTGLIVCHHVAESLWSPSPPSFWGYIERVSAIVNYLLDSPFGPLTLQQMHRQSGLKIHSQRIWVWLYMDVYVSVCVCVFVCVWVHWDMGLKYKIVYNPWHIKPLPFSLSRTHRKHTQALIRASLCGYFLSENPGRPRWDYYNTAWSVQELRVWLCGSLCVCHRLPVCVHVC